MCGEVLSRDFLNRVSNELRDFVRLVRNPKVVLGSLLVLCSECSGGYFGSSTEVEGLRAVDVARKLYGVIGREEERLSGSYLNQVSLALKSLADRGLVRIISSKGRVKYVVSSYGMLVCSLLGVLSLYHTRKSRGHNIGLIRAPSISEAFNMSRVRADVRRILSGFSKSERRSIRDFRAVLLLLLKLIDESGKNATSVYRAIDEVRGSGKGNMLVEALLDALIEELESTTKTKQGSALKYVVEATEEQLMRYLANRIWIPLRNLASRSDNGVAYARVSDLAVTQYFHLVKTFFDKDHPIPRAYRRRFAVHFLDLGPFTLPLRFNSSEGEDVKAAYIRSDFENLVIHYLESMEKAVLISINFPPAVVKEYLGDNVFEGAKKFVRNVALAPNEDVDADLFNAFLDIGGYVIPDIYKLVKEFNSAIKSVFWKSFLGIHGDLETSLLSTILKLDRNRKRVKLSLSEIEKADRVLMTLIAKRLRLGEWNEDYVKSIVEIIPIGTLYLSEIRNYSQKLVFVLRELLRRTKDELKRLKGKTKEKSLIIKCDTELVLLSREAMLRALAILTFIAGIFTKDPAPEPLGRVLKSIDVSSLSETAYTTDEKGLTHVLAELIERIEREKMKGTKTLTEGMIFGTLYSGILRDLIRNRNSTEEKEGNEKIKLGYSYVEKLFFTDYGEALAVARLRDIIISAKLHKIIHIKNTLQRSSNPKSECCQNMLMELKELKEEIRTPLKTTLGILSNIINTFATLNRLSIRLSIRLRKAKYKDRDTKVGSNLNEVISRALGEITSANLSMKLGNYNELLSKLKNALEDLIDIFEYIGSPEGEGIYRIRAIINFYSYPTINSVIGGVLDRNLADIVSMVSGWSLNYSSMD